MITDVYGKEHLTVGDIPIPPELTEYCRKYKEWLKSLTIEDWRLMRVEEIVKRNTPKGQKTLPLFPEWKRPIYEPSPKNRIAPCPSETA